MIRVFLKSPGDLNKKDKNGNTALHLAVLNNSYTVTQLLLIKKVNIEIKNNT